MPAHRKYFNLPECKTCPECGKEFPRPANYRHDRWFKAVLCSLACSSRKGNRLRKERRHENFMAIFDSFVSRAPGQGPKGDCWEWQGDRDAKGYGRISLDYKLLKSHRISLFGLEDYTNPLMACHHCDNPPCCNPAHLFAGSGLDNVQDKMAKGRHRGNHRLTQDQVKAIAADHRTLKKIAAEYGVCPTTIGNIKQGITWKGVA